MKATVPRGIKAPLGKGPRDEFDTFLGSRVMWVLMPMSREERLPYWEGDTKGEEREGS